jgi:uncharacterized Ntn-hydrolase superfamily protein
MYLSTSAVIYIAIACTLGLVGYVAWLHRKLSHFLTGSDAQNLEQTILADRKKVQSLVEENIALRSRLDITEKKLAQSVRSVQTIRFNPFADQGSNQSFATSLVDETGTGVVLSSLYARDRVSVFAKPVANFTSTYELTVEEKQALEETKKQQYGK